MAKVYDVRADLFIDKLTSILKNEDISAPSWTILVKTGVHAAVKFDSGCSLPATCEVMKIAVDKRVSMVS